jgi:predicted nucleic acid-binding protein
VKIEDALISVQRLYIDTAPLIYYVEENTAFVAKMDAIVDAIDHNAIEAFASVITLAEVLTQPFKLGNTALEPEYRDILTGSSDFRLLPITAHIAESCAGLRARHNLKTPDALHIAVALDAGCDAFLTNDRGIQRVTEIAVWVLEDLEVQSS